MVPDKILIERIKASDKEAFETLKTRHIGIFFEVSKRYYKQLSKKNISSEDVVDDYSFILYKAARTYNPSKNVKFSTWLSLHVRYHCLGLINHNNDFYSISDLTDSHLEKKTGYLEKNLDLQHYFEYILKQLSDSRIEKIYKLRYFSGYKKMPWRLIAEKMNISIQAALDLHNRARKLLKQKYLSKDFNDKI